MPPVRHTFVHYSSAVDHRERSHSAPPEYFVDAVLALARRREEDAAAERARATRRPALRRRKLERDKEIDEEAAMLEARHRADDERWRLWSRRVAMRYAVSSVAAAMRRVARHARRRAKPRLRATLAPHLWDELAYKTSVDLLSMCALLQQGIVRRGEGGVQIWISDKSLGDPCMRELMAVANHMTCLAECNAFCVFNNSSFLALPLPYSPTQTVEGLRRTLNTQGRLVHLGRTLTEERGGRLSDYGIRPGSFVTVCD